MNKVLLLTACINPEGMALTVLQDSNERTLQYYKALDFYIANTKLPILIVENTGFDLNPYLIEKNYSDRVEYITFQGNSFDKKLGKGFGEYLIFNKAMAESKLIRNADVVIKISGRYIVSNIKEIEKSICNTDTLYVNYSRINGKCLCDSRLFGSPTFFINGYFLPLCKSINDTEGVYFEHVLYESKAKWLKDGFLHREFRFPLLIRGITGSTGRQIKQQSAPYVRAFLKYLLHKFGYLENRHL